MAAWLALITTAAALASPERAGYCEPLPFDPELPAGVAGKYQVVGRTAAGASYSGTLSVKDGKSEYVVTRKVGRATVVAQARVYACGADRVRRIRLAYGPGDAKGTLWCAFHTDGDNYHRLTCVGDGKRLEAWFQEQ
jgi:hypothetical protein